MTSNTRYRLIMVGPILIVLLNIWVASHALAKLFNAQKWLAHTLEVLTQAEATTAAMGSANNAVRGYLLTGSEDFVGRYHQAASEALGDVARVADLTTDNESQQRRIQTLRHRIAVRFGVLDAVITMRRAQGEGLSHAAMRPALVGESPDGGVTVKFMLTQVQNEEKRLLADRYEEAHAARRNVIFTFGVASALDLVLILWAFQQLISASRDREQLAIRAAKIGSLNAELSGLNAELEQRVEQRTKELEVSNQELQAFSYSVSHDLRAPLRTIDGFSLALAEDFADVLNAEGRDYIQRVRGGVQRMGLLIDALLQLSRVTRSEVQREEVNLSDLATLIYRELAANESGRDLVFEAEHGMLAEADPRLMRVAFENLLGNAIKFTSKTPQASIAFGQTEKDGKIVYFIRDNGAGFDMQYVDRLFTAFQRLHGDRDFKGSGIGLATVSRIIRRHHGTIWAEGSIGAGATFFFTLNA